MISELIKKGFAYENNQHVYFEVKKFNDYGKLSNKKLEDLIAGSRIEVSDNKKKYDIHLPVVRIGLHVCLQFDVGKCIIGL